MTTSEQLYSASGRRLRISCRCPACRTPVTRVIKSGGGGGGEVIRERRCPACGRKWFTAQEPEYIIPASSIAWDALKKPHLRQEG